MSNPDNKSQPDWWQELAKRAGIREKRGFGGKYKPGTGGGGRPWLWISLPVLLVFLLVLLNRGIYFYTDWLWFGEVGQTGVFWKTALTKLGLALVAGAVFFAIVYGNVLLARRIAPRYRLDKDSEIVERVPVPDRIMRWLIPLALLIPTLVAMLAGGAAWLDFLKFTNVATFGVADPVFNRDAGFYVFIMPFLKSLQSFFWWTLIFSFIVTTAVHVLDFAIDFSKGKLTFAPHTRGHLSVLMGLLMFLLGASYMLKAYSLVYSPRGVVVGASYTDVNAQLPVFRFLAATAIVAGILFLINIYFKGWKLPAAAIIIMILTAVIGGRIYPFLVQQYQVLPNEIAREEPYIKYNIDFTRQAFDLNGIEEKSFSAGETLTATDLQESGNTISNIRLWDPATLARTYSQIQVIRPYYAFVDVDVDRYKINGRQQQVMLSPRELVTEQLESRTWQNEHMIFTHGYGVVMSPVAEVSAAGLPELLIKDFPPQSSSPELAVAQPAVYFGESDNEYIVVDSDTNEFDFPRGDENVFTNYSGDGGIGISSWFHRLAFSLRFGSLKLLVSNSINENTRIMINREISGRVRTIAPFLRYDKDPYIALVDGRLYWIQDAYTTTDEYPYSQPSQAGYNYIRNSVKVLVDAYNGDVTFYVVDDEDPLLKAYSSMFPDLFTAGDQIPEQIRAHFRYPEDLFRVQSQMYTTYHMTNPQTFYNKEDQWSVPNVQSGAGVGPMEPYYITMSLPGETQEEFMMMLPFTPSNKDNMISWLVAKSDPESYGRRVVFKFPKEKLIYGPTQIQARINQDPEISRQLSLWAQRGSQVIHGNLLVIPVKESLLYIEPLYLQAERGQIPELKRVTAVYGNQISMQEDLGSALEIIFGAPVAGAPEKPPAAGEATATTPPATTAPAMPEAANLSELAAQAQDHYNKAVEAQKQGDWAKYGDELQKLGDVLKEMQSLSGE